MANEWTKEDIIRIMRDEASPKGEVSLPDVKKHFTLNSRASRRQFDKFVSALECDGSFLPLNSMRGVVKT